MSLKTVSLISLIILLLVFVFSVIHLIEFFQIDSEYLEITFWDKVYRVVNTILWLPFILFFWKVYKG